MSVKLSHNIFVMITGLKRIAAFFTECMRRLLAWGVRRPLVISCDMRLFKLGFSAVAVELLTYFGTA
jgi:hypothetical protein